MTVLAPGLARSSLWGERVVSLGGGEAFGFPGALARLRERPSRAAAATGFTWRALRWLRAAPCPERVVAHFLFPCGVPIATRGLARSRSGRGAQACELEVVLHGSDARLFAELPSGRVLIARELLRARARLRFVSEELRRLVLGSLPEREATLLSARSLVEPAAIDVDGVPSKQEARSQLGLPGSGKLAVIVARLVPSKRVDVALEACRRVAGLDVLVIGDGPERRQLAERFPEARFLGHVTRPLALAHIAAADVLVSASLEEGAPSVVREARALGTAAVCLPAGDLRAWAATDPGLHVVG